MGLIHWIKGAPTEREELVGRGHPTKPDVLNRALREILQLSGLDPDADFAGFQPKATAFTKAIADTLYAALGASWLKAEADARFAQLAGADFTGPVSIAGVLTATSGIAGPIAVLYKTQSYTLTSQDQVLLVDASAGNITITVPLAANGRAVWVVWRVDSSEHTVTLARSGADTGTGPTSITGAGVAVSVVSDGNSKVHFSAASAGSSSSGAAVEVRTVDVDSTLQATDEVVLVDTTGAPRTITVPAANGGERGWTLINIGPNDATIAKTGGDTIVGPTTLAAGGVVGVITDGASKVYVLQGPSSAGAVAWSDVTGKPIPAADVSDEVPLPLGNMGAGKTVTWSLANRVQAGVLDQAACAITLQGIPDGGWLHLRLATGTAGCTVTWAHNISGVTGIVYMNDGTPPEMPAGANQYASILIERLADKLYIHQTGKSQ